VIHTTPLKEKKKPSERVSRRNANKADHGHTPTRCDDRDNIEHPEDRDPDGKGILIGHTAKGDLILLWTKNLLAPSDASTQYWLKSNTTSTMLDDHGIILTDVDATASTYDAASYSYDVQKSAVSIFGSSPRSHPRILLGAASITYTPEEFEQLHGFFGMIPAATTKSILKCTARWARNSGMSHHKHFQLGFPALNTTGIDNGSSGTQIIAGTKNLVTHASGTKSDGNYVTTLGRTFGKLISDCAEGNVVKYQYHTVNKSTNDNPGEHNATAWFLIMLYVVCALYHITSDLSSGVTFLFTLTGLTNLDLPSNEQKGRFVGFQQYQSTIHSALSEPNQLYFYCLITLGNVMMAYVESCYDYATYSYDVHDGRPIADAPPGEYWTLYPGTACCAQIFDIHEWVPPDLAIISDRAKANSANANYVYDVANYSYDPSWKSI